MAPDKPRSCRRLVWILVWIHRTLAEKKRFFVGRQNIGLCAAALIEWLSNECRKTKTKPITSSLHNCFLRNAWDGILMSMHLCEEYARRLIPTTNTDDSWNTDLWKNPQNIVSATILASDLNGVSRIFCAFYAFNQTENSFWSQIHLKKRETLLSKFLQIEISLWQSEGSQGR